MAFATIDPAAFTSGSLWWIVALQATVCLEAVLLLAAVSAALAWTALMLLHPLLSVRPTAHCAIENQLMINHQLSQLKDTSWIIIATLPSVVSLVWYALHAHEYLTPEVFVWFMEIVAVLGFCSLVFFLMACCCSSTVAASHANAFQCNAVDYEALLDSGCPEHHADNVAKTLASLSLTQTDSMWCMTADGHQVVVVSALLGLLAAGSCSTWCAVRQQMTR